MLISLESNKNIDVFGNDNNENFMKLVKYFFKPNSKARKLYQENISLIPIINSFSFIRINMRDSSGNRRELLKPKKNYLCVQEYFVNYKKLWI